MGKQITFKERKLIEEELKKGTSVYDIAMKLNRYPATIYYELNQRTEKNESGKIDYSKYNAEKAQLSL